MPGQINADKSSSHTDGRVYKNIGSSCEHAPLFHKSDCFVGEGGKSGKAAEETNRDAETQFGTQQRAAQAAFHDQTEEQRTDDINGQGPIRQGFTGKVVDPTGDHIPSDAAHATKEAQIEYFHENSTLEVQKERSLKSRLVEGIKVCTTSRAMDFCLAFF